MAKRVIDVPDQPKLTNEGQSMELLKTISPELHEVYEAMQYSDIDHSTIIRMLYSLANVKRFSKWGMVQISVKNGKEFKVEQRQWFLQEEDKN